MAELKTKPTKESVAKFLNAIENEQKRKDCKTILKIMKEVTNLKPKMWSNMIGFDSNDYKYTSGRTGTWFVTGFSPRKANITVYIMIGFKGFEKLLEKLGPHKNAQSCLYLKS